MPKKQVRELGPREQRAAKKLRLAARAWERHSPLSWDHDDRQGVKLDEALRRAAIEYTVEALFEQTGINIMAFFERAS